MLGSAVWVGARRSSCTESPGVPLLTMTCHLPLGLWWAMHSVAQNCSIKME